MINDFLIFAFLFFIGSCLGWCMELLFRRFVSKSNKERKWINPGFLTGPYVPLYGFGLWGMYEVSCMIQMIVTGNSISDILIIFIIMAIIMTAIEYIAGIVFIRGMKVKLWDYSGKRFNIKGVICPQFTAVWGLLGTIYFFTINTRVESWMQWLSVHLTFSFFIGMFFGVFTVDLCYTLQLSAKIRKFAIDNQLVVKYEELKDVMRERRQELKEKRRFIFAFKTDSSLREHLEAYLERSVENSRRKLKEAKEEIRRAEEEIRSKVEKHELRNK